mmetsp:Transcript_16807/g.19237  ORF Transcript_16807/g.19237 Transcript_16807/m.19237 type:complete len:138 (+) Transcript_16807:28-441(+)|eukprot:CAMPEP_0176452122 /NCGR_PEP_ID=MMETSP0127-20121128/28316_1 /TAXON_ID=938130 /ORGANISM="Platyophrya macrostoma, Strain WH" /LENGTH=137 /DNA_ID=CAMNT_0017840453 /DNA_START=28 /DNA_END=441 /DNA_ORIENTATION=+
MIGGASTQETCITAFEELKMKKTQRFITFKIVDEKEVCVDATGGVEATWDDFVKSLPKTEARYGVFDYAFKTDDGRDVSKIIFIYWSPDDGPSRPKMIYAITKEDFKKKLVGIAKDLQANSLADVEQKAVDELVHKK